MIRLALALAAAVTAASAGGAPATRLSIDVWPQGRTVASGHVHYALRCAPAVGTVPKPGAACTALAGLAHPFAATPHGTVCPSLVLGPQEAHVVGTVRGVRVNAWLNLVHCGIDRWNRVKAVVPQPKLTGQAPPPVRPPGGGATTVTTPNGPPPALATMSPDSGPVGTVVTITGTNLGEVVGVQLGKVITAPTSASDTQVVFTVPPGATTGTVKVFSRNGSATTVGTFTVTG